MRRVSNSEWTAGGYTLLIHPDSVSVFHEESYIKSVAAGIEISSSAPPYRPHITWQRLAVEGRFPASLSALIRGVLLTGGGVEPLVDWLIEFGPDHLRAALERMTAAV